MSGTHLKGTLRGHEGCGPHIHTMLTELEGTMNNIGQR